MILDVSAMYCNIFLMTLFHSVSFLMHSTAWNGKNPIMLLSSIEGTPADMHGFQHLESISLLYCLLTYKILQVSFTCQCMIPSNPSFTYRDHRIHWYAYFSRNNQEVLYLWPCLALPHSLCMTNTTVVQSGCNMTQLATTGFHQSCCIELLFGIWLSKMRQHQQEQIARELNALFPLAKWLSID